MENLTGNAASREARVRTTTDAVARRSYGKLIAFLAVRTGDVASAEDALSEAFAAALTEWPEKGCPENPEAWLLTVARRKAIDMTRRRQSSGIVDEDLEKIASILGATPGDRDIPDQRLALMFACSHPAIDHAIRSPLILQAVLGFDAARIASAFLVSPAAMGQRLVRAKKKIREAGIPFRIPEREELRDRLDAVLDAIYATFAEGWLDATGTDVGRRELAEEAIFLGRIVIDLLPKEPEPLGLLALMLHAEARCRTRRNVAGDYVPLAEQDSSAWNWPMIQEAESLILRASEFGQVGRYQLEAALQSAHVYRRQTGYDNWEDVLHLYDELFALGASPVVAINRALAVAEVHGVDAGLKVLDEIAGDPRLAEYQPYWAIRADLLARAGARDDARHAYQMAIGLECDPALRRFLQQRQERLEP